MLENYKLNRKVKKIRKLMSVRERIMFDLIYYSEDGMTRKEIEKACGYKVSGWLISRFKMLGADLRMKNNRYYIKELF